MEYEKRISEDIKEEDDEEEMSKGEAYKGDKKSSKFSSGTKNDENVDNTNKDIKRIDTYNSFGLKIESSNNLNYDTNKSESENNLNKNKEYVNTNTNSSEKEKKQNKKKILKTKDNIQNILSGCLIEILLRSKEDMNIIFKRQKYKNLLDDMKKSNNYFEIYKPLQEKERNINEILSENKRFINKPILMLNVSSKEEIELEFYKYGKTFKRITPRYGIITDNNFYSSTQPIAKFKKESSKIKTQYILNAKEIIKENYEKIKLKNEIWHNEVKRFRIKINYLNDKNKINNFLIYFFEEKERDDILELIKLLRLKMTIKEQADLALKAMEKEFTQKNKLYMILKMLAIKRKLKNKKKIKNYINNDLKKDKKAFANFIGNIQVKIMNKYIEQKQLLINKGIQRVNKYLFLNKDFIENRINKNPNNNYNLNDLRNACNIIYNAFKKPYYKNNNNSNNNNQKNDFVTFKVLVPNITKAAILMNENYYKTKSDWNETISKKGRRTLTLLFEELEDILAEYDAEIFHSKIGEIRKPLLTKIINTISTDSRELHNTIAKSRRAGVIRNGRPLYREFVDVYVFDSSLAETKNKSEYDFISRLENNNNMNNNLSYVQPSERNSNFGYGLDDYHPFILSANSKNIININNKLISDLNEQINILNEKKRAKRFNYKQTVNLQKLNDYIIYEYTKNKMEFNKMNNKKTTTSFRLPLQYRRMGNHGKKEDLIPINNLPKINLEDILILHNSNTRNSMSKHKVQNYYLKNNVRYKKYKLNPPNNKEYNAEIALKYINII